MTTEREETTVMETEPGKRPDGYFEVKGDLSYREFGELREGLANLNERPADGQKIFVANGIELTWHDLKLCEHAAEARALERERIREAVEGLPSAMQSDPLERVVNRAAVLALLSPDKPGAR
jgi:hypothetical protein